MLHGIQVCFIFTSTACRCAAPMRWSVNHQGSFCAFQVVALSSEAVCILHLASDCRHQHCLAAQLICCLCSFVAFAHRWLYRAGHRWWCWAVQPSRRCKTCLNAWRLNMAMAAMPGSFCGMTRVSHTGLFHMTAGRSLCVFGWCCFGTRCLEGGGACAEKRLQCCPVFYQQDTAGCWRLAGGHTTHQEMMTCQHGATNAAHVFTESALQSF